MRNSRSNSLRWLAGANARLPFPPSFSGAADAARVKLDKLGIKTAGSVKAALNTADFSSYLLQAQASGAKVLALNAAADNVAPSNKRTNLGYQRPAWPLSQ